MPIVNPFDLSEQTQASRHQCRCKSQLKTSNNQKAQNGSCVSFSMLKILWSRIINIAQLASENNKAYVTIHKWSSNLECMITGNIPACIYMYLSLTLFVTVFMCSHLSLRNKMAGMKPVRLARCTHTLEISALAALKSRICDLSGIISWYFAG